MLKRILLVLLTISIGGLMSAETGYNLWLRYTPLSESNKTETLAQIKQIYIPQNTKTFSAIKSELQTALPSMLQTKIPFTDKLTVNSLVIFTQDHPLTTTLGIKGELNKLNSEGYLIKTVEWKDKTITFIAGNSEAGVLYGVFDLLRQIQTGKSIKSLNIIEQPKFQHRILNHWDNPDGTVERGYAGHSIWWNVEMQNDSIIRRHIDYARANASIGINGTVINNVNASPEILNTNSIDKASQIADRLRPYRIKVYLSINFSSPKELGGLPTSDPLNPEVQSWWNKKVKEIYSKIPDFGGFLVKANSEGLPGPQDYGRTHADGANMLADALKPHNGIVMWRAFVYNPSPEDRSKQAYNEFKPIDGKFRDNVIIQVKNGPIDFQPREPISPLFGSMPQTSLMPEFQITQEYLGFSNHLVYLADLFKECLDQDTWCKGEGSTVAKTVDGTLFKQTHTAIAGVANIGMDANWCGHHFAQANWYAFGRLAWDHNLTKDEIAQEWIKQTFTLDEEFVKPITQMMSESRETCVNYMTPLGLHHIMGWNHHYGPEPWCYIENARPDWLPNYYHKADSIGLGFNRSSTGSNATSLYFYPLKEQYDGVNNCPEQLLLWFHHVSWNHQMKSGQTLWEELVEKYYSGASNVKEFQRTWDATEHLIDKERFKDVQYKLKVQASDAIWWRDACLLYFQTFSQMQIPLKYERPINDLDEMKNIKLNMGHHN